MGDIALHPEQGAHYDKLQAPLKNLTLYISFKEIFQSLE